MRIYILNDKDPMGGFYSAQREVPNMDYERWSIQEVRAVEVTEKFWSSLLEGKLPVDDDGSNDSTWIKLWPTGVTIWRAGS